MVQLTSCMNSPEIKAKVDADIAIGKEAVPDPELFYRFCYPMRVSWCLLGFTVKAVHL